MKIRNRHYGPDVAPTFKRRRHYRSIKLRSQNRDLTIEDAVAGRPSQARRRDWTVFAFWLLFVLPIGIAVLLGLASRVERFGHAASELLMGAFGACALTWPFLGWLLLARSFRSSLMARPLADMTAIPILSLIILGAKALLEFAAGYGEDAWRSLGMLAVVAILGALWGYVYWRLAGRPAPPYDT